MIKLKPTPKPSAGELEILHVLWEKGPSTVRSVWEELRSQRDVGYTTILKLMQIMDQKSLVRRDSSSRAHLYEAVVSKPATQKSLIGDLLERAFGGNPRELVLRALESKRMSRRDIDEIRAIMDEYERRLK